MNKKNIKTAIKILKRAGRFDLREWQTNASESEASEGNYVKTEAEAKKYCTAACFGGWIALSPEFQNDGGYVSEFGSPCIETKYGLLRGQTAIAYWLDISRLMASRLCGIRDYLEFYHKEDVTARDVIEKLEKLLDNYTYTFDY